MSDIDFLGHKRGEEKELKAGEEKPEVIWSEPARQPAGPKAAAWSFLPFLNKKMPAAAAKRPEQAIDKNKIKRSREEILKLIKNSASQPAAGKNKVRKNLFAGLRKKLAKQPNREEIMVDYQRVFNQEKVKRSLLDQPGRVLTAPAPPPDKIEQVELLKINMAGWLNKLKELLKPKPRLSPEKKPAAASQAKPQKPVEPKPVERAHGDVVETNLIKGEIITFFDWRKKIITFISVILASVFLAAAAYSALAYYQKQSQAKNQEQAKKFEDLTGKIKQEEGNLKEAADFQAKLKIVSQIFAQHLYWTDFFKFLEDNTMKDVYYSGFDGDTGGHYTLDAQAAKFSNIYEQVNLLKNNEKITEVKALGGELVSGDEKNNARVNFTLNFSILKKIFTE
ncbi:MAG: hypothetical protein Q7R92_03980 [bacterium]|nr:hypothetical protein [bacterium]